jgi:hypothetical protein
MFRVAHMHACVLFCGVWRLYAVGISLEMAHWRFLLHHDNAPTDSALSLQQKFLAGNHMTVIHHFGPYRSNLVAFLLLFLKHMLILEG